MTISPEEINAVAPDVTAKAQSKSGFNNPYITLQGLETLCQGETLQFCLHEVVMMSLRYAETVCRFEQVVRRGQQSNEDGMREEIERLRSAVHDSTIDSINVLSRNLKIANKSNEWIAKLTAGGRAAYGKFAILIAFDTVLKKF